MTEKILSYACLYKADTGAVDEILDTDITNTLIQKGNASIKQTMEGFLRG